MEVDMEVDMRVDNFRELERNLENMERISRMRLSTLQTNNQIFMMFRLMWEDTLPLITIIPMGNRRKSSKLRGRD